MTRVCGVCQGEIQSEEAFMNIPGDKVAHERCFSLGDCPRCNKDLRPTENLVGAAGKKYHQECFTCHDCHNPLESFVLKDEKLVCRGCAELAKKQQAAMANPRGLCVACQLPVQASQKAISLESDVYHADCFHCARCKGDLMAGVSLYEGKLHCSKCMKELKEQALESARNDLHEKQAEKQAAAAASRVHCAECKEPITKQALTALGRSWHPECIKCFGCKGSLSGKLYPINNDPHCEKCARAEHEKNNQAAAPAAAPSATPQSQVPSENTKKEEPVRQEKQVQKVEGPAVTCSVCGTSIRGGYQELKGIVHCNDCAEMVQKSIVCDGCRKSIGPGVNFRKKNGKFYHEGCLCCCQCKVALTKDFRENEGKFYCEKDYGDMVRKYKLECPKCHEKITEGQVVEHDKKAYHMNCFSCHGCDKPFTDSQYVPQDGKLFCRQCFIGGQLAEANHGGIIKIDRPIPS